MKLEVTTFQDIKPVRRGVEIQKIAFFSSEVSDLDLDPSHRLDDAIVHETLIDEISVAVMQFGDLWWIGPLRKRFLDDMADIGPFDNIEDALVHLRLISTLD